MVYSPKSTCSISDFAAAAAAADLAPELMIPVPRKSPRSVALLLALLLLQICEALLTADDETVRLGRLRGGFMDGSPDGICIGVLVDMVDPWRRLHSMLKSSREELCGHHCHWV